MKKIELKKAKGLKGEITPPPDKSISHRAVMFASLAEGTSRIENFLRAEDPASTMHAFRLLGVEIEERMPSEPGRPFAAPHSALVIRGVGLSGLKEPFDVVNCGNSGTTIRLLSGVLAGSGFFSVLTGDDSLKQRPMARVVNPLRQMGADIAGRAGDTYPPIAIRGRRLRPVDHALPVASAQVKSCLILAGMFADGTTAVTEPLKSRDHTERMLASMGAAIEVEGLTVRIRGGSVLKSCDMTIPADFSSAAFFIVAALIVPGSELTVRNVCINPTRTGLLEVIKEMGAGVELVNCREVSGEPVADIYCRYIAGLKGVSVGKELIPSLIDEFPILCVLASQAEGITEIRGAGELRVKESDRIKAIATELRKFGVDLEEYPDGIAIRGRAGLYGGEAESYGDHRIAMALTVAGLVAEGSTTIDNASCADISFPGFYDVLRRLAFGDGR
ncbi:MAG TPA: 3-phosphoshikimate 1-carboxyvinyltransferase [Thermodesulfovibrionales bacterium]|nr:3-phosphoshikimate 1-carboxyvinyltransferase [Thermodesulfovibrionales bacterium]